MNVLLLPLAGLAAIGLLASAVIHVMTLIGMEPPSAAMGLHIGIFVVWLPTVVVSQRLTREYKQKDLFLEPAHPDSKVLQFRMFSGHWMAFYGAAAAVLYSATRADQVDSTRACLNGHPVSAMARYCDQCGAPVAGPTG